jgi:hypothetical protein
MMGRKGLDEEIYFTIGLNMIDKDKHTGRISTAPRSGFLLLGKGGTGIFQKLFSMKSDDFIR